MQHTTLPLYGAPPSAGARYFKRKKGKERAIKENESELLRSIRAAFQGSGNDPHPTFRSTLSSLASDNWTPVHELAWDEQTVIWSVGGIMKRKWDLAEEGQPVQYACFGWLHLEASVQSGGSGSAARYTSNDDSFLSQADVERDTFSPFFRARKERMKKVEQPSNERGTFIFLRNIGKVFLLDGREFTFSLPFIVKQAWALHPHGVLMERVLDPSELEDDEPLPTLYTMTNTFHEPRPVGRTEGIKGGYNGQRPSVPANELDGSKPLRSIPAEDHVIWVSQRQGGTYDDLVATISPDKRRISVWRYAYIEAANDPTPSPVGLSGANRASRRGPSMSAGVDQKARSDRIRDPSPAFEPTQPMELPEMPPLSSLPGMPPELSSTATLASLASGATMGSQWTTSTLPRGRGTSLTRNDLTSTMDRMVLGRRSEIYGSYAASALSASLRPVFWLEQMLELDDLSEKDANSWRKITFSSFDYRFDGKRTGSLLAICFPASEKLLLYDVVHSTEDSTLKITLRKELAAVSITHVRATRASMFDLLILQPNSSLSLLTYDFVTIPIEPRFGSQEGETSILDISMADLPDESDLSMASVVDRMKIVGLKDTIESSVTLVFEDGSKSIMALGLNPMDTMISDMIKIIAVYIDFNIFVNIHKRFLHLWTDEEMSESPDVQFDCMAEAILSHFGLSWKKKEPAEFSGTDAWQSLARSSSHFRLYDDTALLDLDLHSPYPDYHPPIPPLSHTARSHLSSVITALHFLAEEMRLTTHRHLALSKLATLIAHISRVARPGWADYTKRLFPYSAEGWVSGIEVHKKNDIMLPLDISSALYSRVFQADSDLHHLEIVTRWKPHCYPFGVVERHPIPVLQDISIAMGALFDYKQKDSRKRVENCVLRMVSQRFSPDWLNLIPLAMALPFREAMHACQYIPPAAWPIEAYDFVGRNDITASPKVTGDLMFNDGYRSVKDHLSSNAPRKTYRMLFEEAHKAVNHVDEAVSGVEIDLKDFLETRFGQDRRLQEVARMLRSSQIATIRMVERQDLNEHDIAKEQHNYALRTAERTFALPLGRAMFTYGSVPTVTREVYNVPKIELCLRLLPHNVVIGPEQGKIAPESFQWAEFHNGAAAALRISPASDAIDSSWIAFNRPTELTAEHAGFLFGLGLTGHLKEMLTWHTFGYLTPKHDLTSIGVLLGLSAANVGSQNKHVTKLLAVHTPALLPSPDVDLNVPLMTQAAGLVGIGLLYMGSKNRRMAEVALHQLSRPDLMQPASGNENRESYTNAAALSFGMIMLGRGSMTTSIADLALLSRLRVLIHGEKSSAFQSTPGKGAFDISLTSPAATIALGMMYLRTNRQDIADILSIPDSIMALERIQPNFLLVRTLARALIMWADIQPTKEWVHKQIPPGIFKVMEQTLRDKFVHDAVELAYYHIVPACCFAIALKYAGTAREEAYVRLIDYYDFFMRTMSAPMQGFDDKIRRVAVRDGLSLISISLAMVMAGTGEINCLRRLRLAHGLTNIMPMRYGAHMATHMAIGLMFLGGGRFTLGNSNASVACMIAAFFPHFPPTSSDVRAYLPALRHLWVLAVEPRCLVARDVDTKEVVYLPMKIRVKDNNNGQSNAQLITPSLIPGIDRLLSIRIDTPRYWARYIDIENNKQQQENFLRSQTIFVKRRTMFLSYLEDPKGSRSLFSRSGVATGDAAALDFPQHTDEGTDTATTTARIHPATDLQRFITSHSNDVSFIAFADRFCRADGASADERVFNAFCHAALYDCIIQDKPLVLPSYLALFRARVLSPRNRFFQIVHQDLVRLSEYYQKNYDRRYNYKNELGLTVRPTLLRETAVANTVLALDSKLNAKAQRPEFKRALQAYVLNQMDSPDLRNSEAYPDLERDLSWYLGRHALPYAPYLPMLRELAEETLTKHSARRPPAGIDSADSSQRVLLEDGIKIILHSAGSAIFRPVGFWTIESFEEVLKIWKMQ